MMPSQRPVPPRKSSTMTAHAAPYYSPLHPEPEAFDLKELSISADNLSLTPLRAHYLKRTLLSLALQRELHALHRPDALALMGPPFASMAAGSEASAVDLPLTRFLLHHFVLSFPLLAAADKKFFSDAQTFVQGFIQRNISSDEEESFRLKLGKRLEKYLALVLSSSIKLKDNDGKEEVVRITDASLSPSVQVAAPSTFSPHPASGDAVASSSSSSATAGRGDKDLPPLPQQSDEFEVNVVTVRTTVVKGRIRNGTRDEFILRTRINGQEIFVSRRYRDFNNLATELRKEFPEEDIRPPPAKDRQVVHHSSSPVPPSPTSPTHSFDSDTAPATETSLNRERNRLTLRAYVRHLLALPNVASSDTMRNFLTTNTTTLSPAEQSSMHTRESLDRARDASTKQFKTEVNRRVQELQSHLQAFKRELMEPQGLSTIFQTIRTVSNIEDLPERYRKLIEWGRISLASALYSTFLGSDDSSSTLAGLKRMHGLMPYWALKGILRISNPIAMIRAFLDLFLARPFGQPSLMQRMLGGGLDAEVKELREDAELVADKIADATLCEKVRAFVGASRETQKQYSLEAESERIDLMAVILRSREPPQLPPDEFQKVAKCNAAYHVYKVKRDRLAAQGKEDPGPDNDDAWLFEDLHVYLRLLRRARDKEQLVQLIFEGSTSDILKDLVTIFYQPLATVYRAANIADSLSDLQNFINDLIRTVEAAEAAGAGSPSGGANPAHTVQTFCDLCARHEQSFYTFVHRVHTKGQDLFDALLHWIERFINLVRDGLPVEPFSLEVLLPHAGKERQEVIVEIDSLVDYHRRLKLTAHRRMRRKLLKGDLDAEAREARDEDSAFVRDVLGGVGASGMADDLEDDQADSDLDETQADSSDESDDDGKANRTRTTRDRHEAPEMPTLKYLPETVDVFVEMLRPGLMEARNRAKQGQS